MLTHSPVNNFSPEENTEKLGKCSLRHKGINMFRNGKSGLNLTCGYDFFSETFLHHVSFKITIFFPQRACGTPCIVTNVIITSTLFRQNTELETGVRNVFNVLIVFKPWWRHIPSEHPVVNFTAFMINSVLKRPVCSARSAKLDFRIAVLNTTFSLFTAAASCKLLIMTAMSWKIFCLYHRREQVWLY